MSGKPVSTLSPRLVIKGADRAVDFYRDVFGAQVDERHRAKDGSIVHCGLRIGDSTFSVTEESLEWQNPGPAALGGSPVILSLECEVDVVWPRAIAAGATVIFPLADQFYGARGGRIADPFGHLWILTQQIEDVSDEEVMRRMAAWEAEQEKGT